MYFIFGSWLDQTDFWMSRETLSEARDTYEAFVNDERVYSVTLTNNVLESTDWEKDL